MTAKTKNERGITANSPRKRGKSVASRSRTRYAFAPLLREFRRHTRKNEARLWIPIETSLIFRYEFAALSPQTRYAFVAILLYCGANGIDEIPLDAKFMSSALIIDERTLRKSFDELLFQNLLQERKEREREKKDTDRQKTAGAGVSVSSENLFKTGEENREENRSENQSERQSENRSENGLIKKDASPVKPGGHLSEFTIEECLRYVEKEISDGAAIQNAKALATKLYQTGEADSFIKARLFPQQFAAEQFGEPVKFSDEPCRVCFGAKMADADGRGFRACERCRNERGKSTGFEPEGENRQ